MPTLKELSSNLKTAVIVLMFLIPIICGLYVRASDDKINRIDKASIMRDKDAKEASVRRAEKIQKDIEEVRRLTIENSQKIAAQNAEYKADSKWIVCALLNIQQDLKELRKK